MARHNEVGKVGEDVACEYLRGLGYEIITRNYRRPYGEIDIVARENISTAFRVKSQLVFVEVKTVSWETARAEENVTPSKLRKLGNVIQAYILQHRYDGAWRFDVLAVHLDGSTGNAKVRHLKDIIIGA